MFLAGNLVSIVLNKDRYIKNFLTIDNDIDIFRPNDEQKNEVMKLLEIIWK